MGRRGRLLREAVSSGAMLPAKLRRERLIHEVIRLASTRMFFDRSLGDAVLGHMNETISRIIVDVLPQALSNVGERYFTIDELTKREDWEVMLGRILQGCAARDERFVKHDNQGNRWSKRKRKGRPATGHWVLCSGCGTPRYATPSHPVRMCRECWKKPRRETSAKTS